MSEQPERPFIAVQIPTGAGRATAVGVHAPIGAVSRKDRARAARTALRQEGPSGLVLATELPGTVSLQRWATGSTWDTLETRPASRDGQTRLELPQGPASTPGTYRVVFAPKNVDITSWISEDVLA
jgi:hypothetical protein